MKRAIISILTGVIFSLAGCDSHREHLFGPYILVAIKAQEQMSVSYNLGQGASVERIEPVVFSVGWNERYIVAKQHPIANRSITNFYYLDMTKDSKYADSTNSVIGPLSEVEFLQKQRELGLPGFMRTINSLE